MELQSSHTEKATAVQGTIKRVLLLEDDPYWQFMIGESLRSQNEKVQIRCVRSFKHAEQVIYQDKLGFDLVIADHFLNGDGTGLDLWRKFQIDHNPVPFVLLSGMGHKEFLDLVMDEECQPAFLEKSSELQKLTQILEGRLSQAKSRSFVNLKSTIKLFMVAAALISMAALYPSQKIPRAERTETIALSSRKSFDVNKIITPDLKSRVQKIAARSDKFIRPDIARTELQVKTQK